jgi:hypothetical protein
MLKRFLVKILVLLTTLTFFACGGGGGSGSKSNGSGDIGGDTGSGTMPEIVYFTVEPESLENHSIYLPYEENRSFTVSWKVNNADRVTITDWIGTYYNRPSIQSLPQGSRTISAIGADALDENIPPFPDEQFTFKITLDAGKDVTKDLWVEIFPCREQLLWLYGYGSERKTTRGGGVKAKRWKDGIVNICDNTKYNRIQEIMNAWNEVV